MSGRKGPLQKINFSYDEDADVMYFFVGRPRRAKTVEVGDDFILRLEPRTGRVIGLTVIAAKLSCNSLTSLGLWPRCPVRPRARPSGAGPRRNPAAPRGSPAE